MKVGIEFYADESHLEMKYSVGNEGNYPIGKYWNDEMCSENGKLARKILKDHVEMFGRIE